MNLDDELTGQAVVAYVVPQEDEGAGVVEAVAAHCAVRLARFKQPSRIEVVGPAASEARIELVKEAA